MSEEEINTILDTIPKTKSISSVGLYNSINVEDLKSAMKRLNKVPNYKDLLKENKNLHQRIKKANKILKKWKSLDLDNLLVEIEKLEKILQE